MTIRGGHFVESDQYRTVRPDGRQDWLLIVTVAGEGIHRGRTGTVRLGRGQAILYGPGEAQDYGTDPGAGTWELLWCHFDPDEWFASLTGWPRSPDGTRYLDLSGMIEHVESAMWDIIRFQTLHRGTTDHRNGQHRFLRNALERTLLWCDAASPLGADPVVDFRVSRATEYISGHLADPLCVAAIAEHVGLSKSRLSHLFKTETGSSLPAYVEELRLERGRDLLSMTHHAVREIAASVGYSDALYFSKRFHARYGVSPSGWRDRLASESDPTG